MEIIIFQGVPKGLFEQQNFHNYMRDWSETEYILDASCICANVSTKDIYLIQPGVVLTYSQKASRETRISLRGPEDKISVIELKLIEENKAFSERC
jgi:hypothetical protein